MKRTKPLYSLVLALAVGFTLACGTAPAPAQAPAAAPTSAPAKPPAAASPAAAKPPSAEAKPSPAPAKPKEIVKLRYGTIAPTMLDAPVVVGSEKGFFKEEGIELEVTHQDADINVVKGVVAKQYEFASVNTGGELAALAEGGDIVLLGIITGPSPFIFAARKEIRDLKDLIDKPVGISAPGGYTDIVVQLLLKQAGIDVEKVQRTNVGGSPSRAAALMAGKVYASPFVFDFINEIEKDPNAQVLFVVGERLTDYPTGAVIVHRDLLKERKDTLVALARSLMRSTRYINDTKNKDEVLKIMGAYLKREPQDLSKGFDLYVKYKVFVEDFAITPAQVRLVQQANVDIGSQKSILPFERVVDLSVREAALASMRR